MWTFWCRTACCLTQCRELDLQRSEGWHLLTVKVAHETDCGDATRLIEKALKDHGQSPHAGPLCFLREILEQRFRFRGGLRLDWRADAGRPDCQQRSAPDDRSAFRDAGIQFISPKQRLHRHRTNRSPRTSTHEALLHIDCRNHRRGDGLCPGERERTHPCVSIGRYGQYRRNAARARNDSRVCA